MPGGETLRSGRMKYEIASVLLLLFSSFALPPCFFFSSFFRKHQYSRGIVAHHGSNPLDGITFLLSMCVEVIIVVRTMMLILQLL